jgi:hypothetical protein
MADEEMCQVLKVFSSIPSGKKNKTELRIVKWEKSKTPSIEKRRMFFNDSENKWINYKASPIDAEDFKLILDNLDEVKELMGMNKSG